MNILAPGGNVTSVSVLILQVVIAGTRVRNYVCWQIVLNSASPYVSLYRTSKNLMERDWVSYRRSAARRPHRAPCIFCLIWTSTKPFLKNMNSYSFLQLFQVGIFPSHKNSHLFIQIDWLLNMRNICFKLIKIQFCESKMFVFV